MPSPLLRALSEKHGVVPIDDASADAFLEPGPGRPAHVILFFAGDPAQRGETHDVAVILPQLLAAFAGRLRAAIVTQPSKPLESRFGVCVFPSLVVARGGEPLGVLPKVYDWADYLTRIEALLAPNAPALAASAGPRVQITFSGRETAA